MLVECRQEVKLERERGSRGRELSAHPVHCQLPVVAVDGLDAIQAKFGLSTLFLGPADAGQAGLLFLAWEATKAYDFAQFVVPYGCKDT